MTLLPGALTPLSRYRQFITWKPVPRNDGTGKVDKVPTDYNTGRKHDAHDPSIWTDYETAYVKGDGHVGFVLTELDPFWCLDIDSCLLPTREWSPIALKIRGYLAQGACEVSVSGEGLHIWGAGPVPEHGCKNAKLGLELYHTGRFIALGSGAVGNAQADCSAGLAEVIKLYFSDSTGSTGSDDWTTEPRQDWIGPKDDDDLIRRLCASKSIAGAFGKRASAKALWTGEIAELREAYPDPKGIRDYDFSSADAALAQHLAFWTGGNCQRMHDLMMRSGLVREKWEREDYLKRTIISAVGRLRDVCIDKLPEAKLDSGRQVYLNDDAQREFFKGCTYIADINKVIIPGGHVYNHEQLDAMMGGYLFVMDEVGQRTTKSAWEAFTHSQILKHPKAHTSAFRPDKPVSSTWDEGGLIVANSYWPIETPRQRGNPKPILDHLTKILPVYLDQQILLSYMAAIVQHPGRKFEWAPLLQGAEGNGKSIFSRIIRECVGKKYCHFPKASQIAERFNDWIENKIFIGVEDIFVPRDKSNVMEELKILITGEWQEIEAKGGKKVSRDICANFILNSNHKDALRVTDDSRRFAIFYCAQQSAHEINRDGMGGEYFPRLYAWLRDGGYAIMNDYLRSFVIPDALNPAKHCTRAPITSSTAEAVKESRGTIEQEVLAAVAEDRTGFRAGWISSHYLSMLVRECGVKMARNKLREMLLTLGYHAHPGVAGGQVHNAVQPDGCKPVLYIQNGHRSINLLGAQVAKQYSEDQMAQVIVPAFAVVNTK